jgi:DNA-binding transcriptional MerR regulator
MRIGELARRTKVSARALRHYEVQGLIESTRLENGYRDYAADIPETVRWIKELIDCGFSTKQVRGLANFIGGDRADPERFVARLTELRTKLHALDTLIGVLTERRNRLSEKIDFYSNPTFRKTGYQK